jgi:hypothetical protein
MDLSKPKPIDAGVSDSGRDRRNADLFAHRRPPPAGGAAAHGDGSDGVRHVRPGFDLRMATGPACLAAPTTHRSPQPGSTLPETDRFLLAHPDFDVHLADTVFARRQAAALVARMYETRGYLWELGEELPTGPRQLTFVVRGERGALGTLTLRFDSDRGLLADELYRSEIDACRGRGGSACELVWFAFHPGQGSKELLAHLFHLVYIYARLLSRATDMFIEVNPRHAGFYRRALGFRQVGPERTCSRVGAPAVLLCLDLAHADREIARFAGGRERSGRTLYPYFLSAVEREALFKRILEHA